MDTIDKIWKKASDRFPTSITAWLKNFSGDSEQAKLRIEYLLKILFDELDSDSSMLDANDAVALVRLMTEEPEMTTLISSYLNKLNDCRSSANSRKNHILVLHVAAKNGCISHLRQVMKTDQVNVSNSDGETPLHLAAEFEHLDDVMTLLEFGAEMRADNHGCTPLHSAAMSNCPNATIARLLVDAAAKRGDNFRLLNERSNPESGRNTALHVAAGNVNVTAEFIKELRETDPRLQNAELDTPFHVAAKSSNPNIIGYLLSTFKPTNAGWDIDSVDDNRDDKAPSLLSMCAGNGNAEAVALLIQRGADVSRGVLHEIVVASVKKPEMMTELMAVYQAVVNHAVTGECRKQRRKCPIRGSSSYNEHLRETMIDLTTKPFVDDKNMIRRAIKLGASEMLMAILNTDNVYKFDEFGVRRNDRLRLECSYSRYDVTEFVRQSPTMTSYLVDLLRHQDEWKDKNILAEQPLRKITKPYFRFVQGYYFLLGLIQLIFMIFFSAYYIPDTCTLASMFGSNMSRCNISTLDASLVANDSNFTAAALERESPSWNWLTWPLIVSIISMTDFYMPFVLNTAKHLARYVGNNYSSDHSRLKVLKRLNVTVWPTKMLLAAANSFPLLSFCISVFVWFYRHAHSGDRRFYLEALSMVFLFGWMANFVLFSRVTEQLYVFLIVLNEIIVQDIILRFNLVFFCTVIGFSFSLYVLRLKDEMAKDATTSKTGYDVFVSALGIGSYFENTRKEMNDQMGLFRIVFAFYIFFTAVILLNVLIAMMNNRYEDAKKRAQGVWRFEVIKTAHLLENFTIFSIDKCNWLCCHVGDIYEDNERWFVDVRPKVEDE